MNLIKCANGHFYDQERYSTCPHCSSPGVRGGNLTMPVMRGAANEEVTVALEQSRAAVPPAPAAPVPAASAPVKSSLQEAVQAASAGAVNAPAESGEKTVGFFSNTIGTEPVVGWLVCTGGEHFGEDFRLKSGRNFIGRASGMDVAIIKDGTVSRARHVIVVYEPRGNVFLVQPGDSKELSYLNGEVVLAAKEIKTHDRLTVGNTELMFIPCCTPSFNWEPAKASL